VSTQRPSVYTQTTLFDRQVSWVYQLVSDGQLLADLAFADIIVWAPTESGSFVAVSHLRPSSAATLFYRDVVESDIRPEWFPLVSQAYTDAVIVDSKVSSTFDDTPTKVRAVPITMAHNAPQENTGRPVAVLTRHTNLSESRIPGRQELTFNECADALLLMVSEGTFPDSDSPSAPARGAPRASDGLIRLDEAGVVTFASPNALSAFKRMGFLGELEGTQLAEVTAEMLAGTLIVDESLPLVVTGRAPWRSDIDKQGVTITLRAIPVKKEGKRTGAIVVCRDVTEVRLRERAMLSKDATIREIHHRVKNNLQTVASLLRIQSRRTTNDVAKDALNQAMRRVAAIAVVHDTLSEGLTQSVDFDVVLDRVLKLVVEVASATNQVVEPRVEGSVGVLPSEYATPLALVLTELVTNAVEHGLKGQTHGEVHIHATRSKDMLRVVVSDDGGGLPRGLLTEGLGTQIVKTLVHGELGGIIDWDTQHDAGTRVTIDIPMQFMHEKALPIAVPGV
jgi:two-component sensor histidine kinase